jgi:hypothetical protein
MGENEKAHDRRNHGQENYSDREHSTEKPGDSQATFCSGFGQYHSPNHPKKPQSYITATLEAIEAMARNPAKTAKSQAQWVIFSDLLTRCHREQLEQGRFFALWADVDQIDVMTFDQAISRTLVILPFHFISYTTSGATWFKQKFRIILPLAISIPGKFFVICQKILNDKLEAIGIEPDRASERPGQICYLPNRGEFYRHHINDGETFHPGQWRPEIRKHLQKPKPKKLKPKSPPTNGDTLIDRFNSLFSVESVLASYGYQQRGKKWLSPNSESKQPGVTIDDGKWFSCHGTDAGIGRPTPAGTFGDSFDLFVYYEHQGNRADALKAAGKMIGGVV